jgi:hypothetical protein
LPERLIGVSPFWRGKAGAGRGRAQGGRRIIRTDQAAQNALPDTTVGHAQTMGGPKIEDRFKDGASRHHQIGPFAPDTGQFAPPGQRHGRKALGNAAHALRGHDHPIHGVAVILRQVQMHRGQRRHRAAGAQQAQGARRAAFGCTVAPRGDALGKGGKAVIHPPAHFGIALDACAQFFAFGHAGFGQRNHAPGDAHPIQNRGRGIAVLGVFHQHQFGRSTANVEDQRGARPRLQQDMTAQHGQTRLFPRRDDVQTDTCFGAHTLDEIIAVAGAAACLGRDRARQMHIAPLQLFRADPQSAQRPVHRLIRQTPRLGQTFAQTHHAAEGVDHHEAVPGGPGDQQAAVVRAKIDGGIRLTRRGR